MKIRLLIAVLLISLGFLALHFVVGFDQIVRGGGSKTGPIQTQDQERPSTGRIAVNEQGIGIGGRGKFQLSLNTVEIELGNGDLIPVPQIVVRGTADTPQGDTLEVVDGTIEFFEPRPEDYAFTGRWAEAVARAEFGQAIFVIGRDPDGEISMLDATRDLDLRDATVRLLGDRPVVLRDARRLRVREDAGILSFDAPPIEGIPQPVLIELQDDQGLPVTIQGFGIEGSFPTDEGTDNIEFEILERPTIERGSTRVEGQGRARYDERGSDGAGRFVMDGGLHFTSREFDAPIDLDAESLDLRLIRLTEIEADPPVLPRGLALVGEVQGTYGTRRIETDRVDIAFSPTGRPYHLKASDSVRAESPEDGGRARLRGAVDIYSPGVLFSFVHRGYGIRGDGLPFPVGGIVRIGGTSESEVDGAKLTAGGRVLALGAASGNVLKGLTNEGLARANGPIVFERDGVVVRAESGVDLLADSERTVAVLGPRTFDPDHGFSITRRDAENDLVFSGQGSAQVTQWADGSAEVFTRTPNGRGRLRSNRFQVAQIDRVEARVTAEGELDEARLIGASPLDARGTLSDGRSARIRAGLLLLPSNSQFVADAPEEGPVELELDDSRVLGTTLTGKSLFGAVSLRTEGAPARVRARIEGKDADPDGASAVEADLQADSITSHTMLLPPFLADLHRAPVAMPNALRTPFLFARGRVSAETSDASGSSLATGDLLITRPDQKTAWLFGSPAQARSLQTDGQAVTGTGPVVRIDLGDTESPRLALLPEGSVRPSIVLEQESNDPALKRLEVTGSGPLALDGGTAEIEGPVRIRSLDENGLPMPDGLELIAPELAFEWNPADRTLRRLTARGGATFSLRDLSAEAEVLDLDGLEPTLDGVQSWTLKMDGSREKPAVFRSARTGEVRSVWMVLRYPEERLSIGPTVFRLRRSEPGQR